MYNDICFPLAISFDNFEITDSVKKGIFFPLREIFSEYKRYTFSRRFPGLYFINGMDFVACIFLNIDSSGIFTSNPLRMTSENCCIPLSIYGNSTGPLL